MLTWIKSFAQRTLPYGIRERLSSYKKRPVIRELLRDLPQEEILNFQCNICGQKMAYPRARISRELWSCAHCGSNVRWRSVIHALSMELFGRSMALPDFPTRSDIAGLGLSDWDGYATRLAKKLSYTNTHYHKSPFLDITRADRSHFGRYDFIISSDVFEHISPPTLRAFENARRMLKPGGVMIFTVPYLPGMTKEHFPNLTGHTIINRDGQWILTGQTMEGGTEEFTGLTFHGGPGTVLEFRIFGKDSLFEESACAGFEAVRIHDETVGNFGIYWNPYSPEQAPYRPLIYGLDTPPWALENGKTMAEHRDEA